MIDNALRNYPGLLLSILFQKVIDLTEDLLWKSRRIIEFGQIVVLRCIDPCVESCSENHDGSDDAHFLLRQTDPSINWSQDLKDLDSLWYENSRRWVHHKTNDIMNSCKTIRDHLLLILSSVVSCVCLSAKTTTFFWLQRLLLNLTADLLTWSWQLFSVISLSTSWLSWCQVFLKLRQPMLLLLKEKW